MIVFDHTADALTKAQHLSSIARLGSPHGITPPTLKIKNWDMTHSPFTSPQASMRSHILLHGATLHTCDQQGVIPIGGVLVNPQGKFDWVGPLSEWTQIKDRFDLQILASIDCSGEHICPGFIDAHVHLGLYPEDLIGKPKDFNELTNPLTPEFKAIDEIWPGDITFDQARRGGITTMCVLPGSANIIGGAGVVLKTSGIDVEQMCVRDPACLKITLGFNVKDSLGHNSQKPLTRMMFTSILRDAFDAALRYEEQRLLKPDMPIDRGKEAILLALRREIPVRAHASRSDDILTATRLARDYGFKLMIEHGYEADRVIPQLLNVGASVIYGTAFRTRSHSEDLNFDCAQAQTLLKAGIKVAQMSDHPIVPIQYLSLQAGLCVRAGMNEDDALLLITAHPADLLGVDEHVGRLRAGLDADLLRLSGPPLEVKTRVFETWINGEVVLREAHSS